MVALTFMRGDLKHRVDLEFAVCRVGGAQPNAE
jgi:hypothetical protein